MINKSKGFTLIELLTVIIIIGILSTLLIANFAGSRVKARDTRRKEDLAQLSRALESFYQENQYYPDAKSADASPVIDYRASSSLQTALGGKYITNIPSDPMPDKAMGTACKDSGSPQKYCDASSGPKRFYLYGAEPWDPVTGNPANLAYNQSYALFTYLEDPSATDSSTVLENSSGTYCASSMTPPTGTLPTGTTAYSCVAAYVISSNYSVRTLPSN